MRGKLNETCEYNYRYTCISFDHHEHHGIFFTVNCLCRKRSLFVVNLHLKIHRGIVLLFFGMFYIRELEIFQNFVLSPWTIVTLDHIFTSRGKKSDIERNSILEVQMIGTN